ncbi:hypothetical protein JIN85_10990 [Luteolibacter pohnpeiensis]|uniref:Uncharacterized protein n=1 Tax=Luteolibacter pohnpeiensis TaxID=454153 RepID=A0A934S7X0_9BACT|nr:hypothetical protein [Luteolibacter pohnpeiensis]MBK1882945.1 hypothetical protein [Luteolibacter pohnpeiensis]
MKSISIGTIAFVGMATLLSAEVPRKAPITRYTKLWTESLFTTKPPPLTAQEEKNPLEDYTLAGISPISDGYRITVLNRKNPEDRISFDSNDSKAAFKLVSVKKGDRPMDTVVRLSAGSKTGTVRFEPELLTLKAAPIQQPNNPNPNAAQLPPGVTNNANQNANNGNVRQPRPRAVPPPTTGTSNSRGQNNNGTQRQQGNNTRQERRGR